MTASAPDDRRRLIVEVTESVALADIAAANRRLGVLRDAGIKLCIDDFGAGAASFDYLHGLSVDTVKIDGKFVQALERDPKARTVIAHLIEMCTSLKLSTIGEFVETEASADILRSLGVDYAQGWLFGKAEAEPRTVLAPSSPVRRRGAVEAWG
jgi:EAL domain-containing protein (putative c-di-GMP-specific phosphodiesterase class I)